MKNLYYTYPSFKDTTNFEHIKQHYFSESSLFPSRPRSLR